jgi:dihydrofolate reductase
MSKIILYIATSLDGFIAKKDGSVDWLSSFDEDYGYEEFLSSIDTIIMGSKTYQQVLSFGEWPYKGLKTFVFTHQKLKDDKNVEFISGSIPKAITGIKKQSTKNIWLVGGGNLITEFVKQKLIDEFQIFIMPLFLGAGIPILQESVKMNSLKYSKSKSYKSGVIELHLKQENK